MPGTDITSNSFCTGITRVAIHLVLNVTAASLGLYQNAILRPFHSRWQFWFFRRSSCSSMSEEQLGGPSMSVMFYLETRQPA
jgi:hypothetical protein